MNFNRFPVNLAWILAGAFGGGEDGSAIRSHAAAATASLVNRGPTATITNWGP